MVLGPGKSPPCSDRSRRFPYNVKDMCKMLAPPSRCLSSANAPLGGILTIANSAHVNNHSRHGVFTKRMTFSCSLTVTSRPPTCL